MVPHEVECLYSELVRLFLQLKAEGDLALANQGFVLVVVLLVVLEVDGEERGEQPQALVPVHAELLRLGVLA